MGKKGKVYFLASYIEYLFNEGIKSEEYYLGDASRFLRFLLSRVEHSDIEAFVKDMSPSYEKRLKKTLRKFCAFAQAELNINNDVLNRI
ncbi:MAG: hypothetical protein GX316_03035 [Firmicutes bacterium]|mgnify:CR=1 FL=1|nr:hypothetical protein [Bacillota bacterium]